MRYSGGLPYGMFIRMLGQRGALTLHQDLLDLLAQLLHNPLREVMTLLRLLKPFIEARIGPQIGGARTGYS